MQKTANRQGCFVAVVGPSGAGKDTVLNAARETLSADPRYYFTRRFITRPKDDGNEDHISLDAEAFVQLLNDGQFALHWQAHGHSYGLPLELDKHVNAGGVVIGNISRRVLQEACKRYSSFHVFMITAEPAVLAERLALRRRESREEIAMRLAREVPIDTSLDNLVTIDNSGDVQQAKDEFVAQLKRIGEAHLAAQGESLYTVGNKLHR